MNDGVTGSEAARRDEVRRIGAERRGAVAALLAESYRDDPLVAWTLAADEATVDDDARLRYWYGVVAGLPPAAEIHATYETDAVAVWVPSVDGDSTVLLALAVAPHRRGRGLAGRVLEPMLQRADRLGLVLTARCTSSEDGRRASRFGFGAVGSERFAPDGPTVRWYRREPST